MQQLYDEEANELDPWTDSPNEVTEDDWRDYLGEREFQRAYLDFFDDELTRNGYDWKKVVAKIMLSGPNPLIYGAFGGLGHPLIHLGYAFELNSKDVATEALALAATNWNFLHKYILEDFPTPDAKPIAPPDATSSPFDIIEQIRKDPRFNDLFESPGASNIPPLFEAQEAAVLEYYHKLSMDDPVQIHRDLTKLATLLLCTTHAPGEPKYDFFICHLLTTAYAVRTILPELPAAFTLPVLKGHWLFIVIVYLTQLRPDIKPDLIEEVDISDKSWEKIVQKTLAQKKGAQEMEDAHYLKAVRTLQESAKLWSDEDTFFRKAAAKIAWEFDHWGGFGNEEEQETKRERAQVKE